MKKILLTLTLGVIFVGTTFSQIKFGVTAGLNVSNFSYSEDEKSDFKAGFQVGVLADYAITENFSIIPELSFSQRGCKIEEEYENSGVTNKVKESVTLNYLQLPINAAYKFDLGLGSKLLIFAGPYLGYALSGTDKFETDIAGISTSASEKINFGSKEEEIKAFDFGITGGVGYQYANIFFKLQYNLGLGNLSNSEGSVKNTNIGVTAGYLF
jgi:hypothetical protein